MNLFVLLLAIALIVAAAGCSLIGSSDAPESDPGAAAVRKTIDPQTGAIHLEGDGWSADVGHAVPISAEEGVKWNR